MRRRGRREGEEEGRREGEEEGRRTASRRRREGEEVKGWRRGGGGEEK